MRETAEDSSIYDRAIARVVENAAGPRMTETIEDFVRRIALAGIEAFEDEIDRARS